MAEVFGLPRIFIRARAEPQQDRRRHRTRTLGLCLGHRPERQTASALHTQIPRMALATHPGPGLAPVGNGHAGLVDFNVACPATIRFAAGELSYEIPGQGDVRPDFLKIIQRLSREKYPPLLSYFTSLDINPRVWMLKMLAILILREAADRNPPGALDASNLYDQIYAKLRPLADEGLRIQRGRKKGGRKTARTKKFDVAQRNQKILLAAKRSRAAGEQRGAIVNDLAEQHSLDPRSIRRILSDAGF